MSEVLGGIPERPRRFRQYSEYKDSGVEWLGEIPAEWQVVRTKFVARLESGHTPSRQRPEYWQNCTIPWFGLADVWQIRDGSKEYVSETNENVSELGLANSSARLLPKGTVIVSRTASVGFSAIMGADMATTQDFVNWICGPRLKPEYLLYVFRSMGQEFRRLVMGSTHQTIYMPDVGSFTTPVPPIEEQAGIIAFVRRETTKIDALVAKNERLIELLQEKRTALIARAVTKGLDPNVPMKDSGIGWLGEIPAHWGVKKLGWITKCLDGRRVPLNAEERGRMQGEYPYWGANSIVDRVDSWLFDEHLVLLGEDGAPFFDRLRSVAFHVNGKIWVNNHAHVLRPTRGVDPGFLTHVLNCVDYRAFIDGSTRDKLTQRDMNAIPIQVPPLDEQMLIRSRADAQAGKIDGLMETVGKGIDRLKEFRTALISAAVTGKIDVREEAV